MQPFARKLSRYVEHNIYRNLPRPTSKFGQVLENTANIIILPSVVCAVMAGATPVGYTRSSGVEP